MGQCVVCGKDSGKGRTCSSTCRKALQRRNASVTSAKCDTLEYVTLEGKIYGRQAVRYDLHEAWYLRPEPLSPNDRPKPLNRGKYIRPDGSEYQFDCIGKVFECSGPNSEVYPTWADLRAVQAKRKQQEVTA